MRRLGQHIKSIKGIREHTDNRRQIKNNDQDYKTFGYFLVDLASRLWLKRHDNDFYFLSDRYLERLLAVRTPRGERGFGIKLPITKNDFRAVGAVANVELLFLHTVLVLLRGFLGVAHFSCSASESSLGKSLMGKVAGLVRLIPSQRVYRAMCLSWTFFG